MPRAYAIRSQDIADERERVDHDLEAVDISRVLRLDEIELPPVGPSDVHVRILVVSAEHNVGHAALADTVNIADLRGGKIYPGNSAVVEVVEVGAEVDRIRPGDIMITHCNGQPDSFGYPLRIWAYDQPDSIGWYGEEAVVGEWQLVPAPLESGLNLWEIAALPLRAPTAYHLWRRAIGILRVKIDEVSLPQVNVLGFGGGVSELFLMLAKARGHNTFFCSGNASRRAAMERQGATTIDQTAFHRFSNADDGRAFGREMKRLTDGVGAHIVCDMLRGPVFAAGVAASAREGVNVSAGWQLDKEVRYDSAALSVKQITLDHVHYETVKGCHEATALYGSVFKPLVHDEVYGFEELPRAFQDMHCNRQTGIPIVRVTDDLPQAVRHLI